MKLQVKQAGGAQELTVGSQKEFLQLWNRGVIAGDDLVLRGDRWVPAAELPWIRGMAIERKRDSVTLKFQENASVDPEQLARFVSAQRGAQFTPDGMLKFLLKATAAEEAVRFVHN